ncbi:DUF2332 domain-containing protein [uncultured Roseobacter sp.]|uniref:DUF2332 domain-containing protein n=1 Tax=uncultured Roseobacter sp. TaxID=114847 RepID=UPI0026080587|nr:DUF2332 domain-containing protein [uncultured Roseobacter sp.]
MNLRDAFAHQSLSCAALGSPFMAQLMELLAAHWPDGPLADHLTQFEGDLGPAGASLPLRVAGGLHALVLSGRDPDLAALYPPAQTDETALRDRVLTAFETHADFLIQWTKTAPQTNEVRRSAALMAGACVAADHAKRPIVLSELGASGGLNLMWDHYALDLPCGVLSAPDPVLRLTPEWSGPVPKGPLPRIAARAGVDLSPLDPTQAKDMLRLTAYLWPDQPERLALTRAAAAVMTALIDRGDAIDWLEQRLHDVPEGHLHLIQHTVAWQYFPPHAQARGQALIEAAGALATENRPLAWLSMESDGDTTGKIGAAVTLRFWPGDLRLSLGRADFHGRWIQWTQG